MTLSDIGEWFLSVVSSLAYPIVLTTIVVFIYFLISGNLGNRYRRKVKRINTRIIDDAVPTDSPIDDHAKTLKTNALDRLEDRFSLMRKSLPFVLFFIWVILVTIPYLSHVPPAYVTIIAGVISLLAGFSLRPFLENLFSGVVIAFFRYVRVGDTVIIDEQYGLIEELGVTHSILKRWDWQRVIIPNTQLLQKEIQNLTLNDQFIWANVEFYVSPDSDLERVESIAVEIASQSEHFSGAEPPTFWVMDMEKDAVKCWITVWTNSPAEAWGARHDIRTGLVKAFNQAGIKLHTFSLKLPTSIHTSPNLK
jgi:moderate conductance mechanosensitive channel